MDRSALVLLLAQGLSAEQIGERFGKHASTVSYWMAKHGLEAVNREQHAPKGGVDKDRLEELVQAGMSTRELANALGLSQTSVRHWLRRYDLKTKKRRDPSGWKAAKEAGLLGHVMTCVRHGETEFVLEGRGYYRCKRCRAESVAKRRRRVKEILVAEAGGRCSICGYDRYIGALEFHHVDPGAKRLTISWNGVTRSLDVVRTEARKCVLLCSNCHAEVEAGAAALPRYAHDESALRDDLATRSLAATTNNSTVAADR
jgi:transposase